MPLTSSLTRPITSPLSRPITSAPMGGGGAWSPASLFASGEQGVWYDPSDLSTMFQDAAGTIPVTAVEQPVGRILDKSGRGNHATQATAASRPKLSARVNLLLSTTTLATQSVTMPTSQATLSFKGTGTVTLSGASTAGPLVGTGASDRVSLTFTLTAGSVTFTVSGSVTDAQLEYGASATRYQRVTTATDYDTAGFPHRLKFDGVDDFLYTAGNVNFSAIDEVTVIVGITKFVDTPVGYWLSHGTDPAATSGFHLTAPAYSGGAGWGGGSRGTAGSVSHNAPNSPGYQRRVITLDAKIGTDRFKLRQNGVEICSAASDQGTGFYGDKRVYIGRGFGGTSAAANIEWSSFVIRGAQTADVTPGEQYAATKHGVTLP